MRAFAATTKNLVESARVHHNTSPVATAALGRTLTAGAIMGSMMKNDTDMLTLQIRGDGPIEGITVTADSHANVKGYVGNPDVMLPPKNGKLDVGGAVGSLAALDVGVLLELLRALAVGLLVAHGLCGRVDDLGLDDLGEAFLGVPELAQGAAEGLAHSRKLVGTEDHEREDQDERELCLSDSKHW